MRLRSTPRNHQNDVSESYWWAMETLSGAMRTTRTKCGLKSGGNFELFRVGVLVRATGGPPAPEALQSSGPRPGAEQSPAAPRPPRARPAFRRPHPAVGSLQMLPRLLDEKGRTHKEWKKGFRGALKKRGRGGERGEEGHRTAAAAVPWWPGARVCVSVSAFRSQSPAAASELPAAGALQGEGSGRSGEPAFA